MTWNIPLFDLHFEEEEKQAALRVMDSGWISTGSETLAFEKRFAEIIGVEHAVAVNSGTAALHLAVLTLGIGPGDEVIVPSLTFAATVNVVLYTGAKPIFADITSRGDLTISPGDIRKKINHRTKAIMVMHYGGFACSMGEILDIAMANGVAVLEDAAHAPGGTWQGKNLGTFGESGAFSFFSNKNITTAEGGMLVTNRKEVADQARLLRSHGMTTSSYDRARGHATSYDIRQVGYNYRIDDIRAAIGRVQLERLAEDLRKRRILAERYHQLLEGIPGITLPFKGRSLESTNYIFPVVLREDCPVSRDMLREMLEKEYRIQTSVHYPAVHRFSQYADPYICLPETDYVSNHEMTLPLYYRMTEEDVATVCSSLREIIQKGGRSS